MPKPLLILQRMYTAEVGVIPVWQAGVLLAGLALVLGLWIAGRRSGEGGAIAAVTAADRAWLVYGLCIGLATPWLLAWLWRSMAVSADDYRLELRLWALGASVALRCVVGLALLPLPARVRRGARLVHGVLHGGLLLAVLGGLGSGVYHTGAVAVGGFLLLQLVATVADLLRAWTAPAADADADAAAPADPASAPPGAPRRSVLARGWPLAVGAQIALLALLLIGRLLLV